jgi:choline dehydrogenase-like flavoprotein
VNANTTRDLQNGPWDILVIGTGMGGATLGYALARQGKRVLFCEKGRNNLSASDAHRGNYAEMFFPRVAVPGVEHALELLQSGRWSEIIADRSNTPVQQYIPFLGCGTGGSTALYGGVLERFFPQDFTPGAFYLNPAGFDVPETWPIQYADLAPFYAEAERLYGVSGGPDPLRPDAAAIVNPAGPPFTASNQALSDFLQSKGLHPYRLPLACDLVSGCQTCQGFLCSRGCKIDTGRACLLPAVRDHGAVILDECEALRLNGDSRRVTSVTCMHRGQPLVIKTRTVVLAAGALVSPTLMLRSTSPEWPDGLANTSGMVGRNLMRHCIDLYALAPLVPGESAVNLKELGCNDFYIRGGEKLGNLQSFGKLPPASILVESLHDDVRTQAGELVAALLTVAKPLLRKVVRRALEHSLVLATTLEDLPDPENRVLPITGRGIAFRYQLRDFTRVRIARFRKIIKDTLAPLPFRLIKQAENNERLAHVCGTCRMGKEPATSVVDAFNRAHGVDNLYIVDSSFFPTSGGTNPSLTIAANALRVAAALS